MAQLRVIGGIAKGCKLKRVPGDTTRPIMDRAKESLFNILTPYLWQSTWLDLFAGTGQVGIEALSRGAEQVVFTDNAKVAVRTIKDNLKRAQFTAQAEVWHTDAMRYLPQAARPFDFIYVAPPQYKEMWLPPLLGVDEQPERLLRAEGMVVVQIDPREYQELALNALTLWQQRRYGNTMFCFYRR